MSTIQRKVLSTERERALDGEKRSRGGSLSSKVDLAPLNEAPLSTTLLTTSEPRSRESSQVDLESEANATQEQRKKKKVAKKKRPAEKYGLSDQTTSRDTTVDQGHKAKPVMLQAEALKMRFQTEVQQLEMMHGVEQHLNGLQHAKEAHAAQHEISTRDKYIQGLKQTHDEIKRAQKHESRAAFGNRIKTEVNKILSSRIERLLSEQTKASEVTAEATRQLAELQRRAGAPAATNPDGNKVRSVADVASSIRREDKENRADSSRHGNKSKPLRVEPLKAPVCKPSTPEYSKELQSLLSRTESNVPEILSAIENSKSLSKTISEALDVLSLEENGEVEEQIETDYSLRFEDGSESKTIKEAVGASKSVEASQRSAPAAKTGSQVPQASYQDTFEPEEEEGEPSNAVSGTENQIDTSLSSTATLVKQLTVVSPSDSFNQFTLKMLKQQLEQESLMARHQYQLLKRQEAHMVTKARASLARIKEDKKSLKQLGTEDALATLGELRKQEQSVLASLKKRRKGIDQLKQGIKVAEKERKLLLEQQHKLIPTDDDETSSIFHEESKTTSSRSGASATTSVDKPSSSSTASSRATEDSQAGRSHQEDHDDRHTQDSPTRNEDEPPSLASVGGSPSKMESLRRSLGTLKTPLSPKQKQQRTRPHSGLESDDSLSMSQAETASDHSDVEIRINTLQEELRRRMQTAARLKKRAQLQSKEKLRGQELALKKQIEKYDKLIEETKADIEDGNKSEISESAVSVNAVVQPQIKTPYMQLEKPSRKASAESVTDTSCSLSAPQSPLPGRDSEVAGKQSLFADLSSLSPREPGLEKKSQEEVLPNIATVFTSRDAVKDDAELIEDEKQSESNYSDEFTSSEDNGDATGVEHIEDSTPKAIPGSEATADPGTRLDTQADRISQSILNDVLSDVLADYKHIRQQKRKSQGVAAKPSSSEVPFVPRPVTVLSPRSRPQDLMLSTFDISSESSDEDLISPKTIKPMIPVSVELDNDGEDVEEEGNFIDDDFGLGNIYHESEQLKKQQKLIEEEISRIQQERQTPDKPPPPYTPPAYKAKLAQPTPVEKHIPSSEEDIVKLLKQLYEPIFRLRNELSHEALREKLISSCREVTAGTSGESHNAYVSFLVDLVLEISRDIYKCESEEQNPPWMPQKPLARARRGLPRSAEELGSRLQREVLILLGFQSRAIKENLVVRWSQKKRDRVDEILVRELHAEEAGWTDYSKDEALVKDQLADLLLTSLIEDTVREVTLVSSKK